MAALAGANQIYGPGMLESGMTVDYAQLLLDNEIIQMIMHCVRGIPVSDETLMIDDIREVGYSSDFVGMPSTLEHMYEHQSIPKLIDRSVREDWEARGATDVTSRALEEARAILSEPKSNYLPDDVRAEVRRIRVAAEEKLGIPAA
jgi:trimethylamine--corrinoid protein Co-methyltransferase